LVVGKKEAETHSVSIRRLSSEGQTVLPLADALAALVQEATPPVIGRARQGTSSLRRACEVLNTTLRRKRLQSKALPST
jgi:hypothetical protein